MRQGALGAVLMLDLDFKGRTTPADTSSATSSSSPARRFERVTRTSDSLCCFGGDEFLYLAPRLNSPEEATQVVSRLLATLAEPFFIAGAYLEQHASVGVMVWASSSVDTGQLIQDADVALCEAKRSGKGHHALFTLGMRAKAQSRVATIRELRHSFQSGELMLHSSRSSNSTRPTWLGSRP